LPPAIAEFPDALESVKVPKPTPTELTFMVPD
jgi:hypothetical protein